jgi:IS5 family transposase
VLRHFVGIDLGRAPVPDESTILGFRHLLEKHELGGAMLNAVNQYLESRGIGRRKYAQGEVVVIRYADDSVPRVRKAERLSSTQLLN